MNPWCIGRKATWYKLILILICCISLLAVAYPAQAADIAPAPAAFKSQFSDVSSTDANAIYINFLAGRGIIKGYPDGGYHPNEALTRAQAATVIVKAAGLSVDSALISPFKDVSDKHWAKAYIATAAKAGYISGMPDGSYHSEEKLTRAQAISLILRLSKQDISGIKLPAGLTDIDDKHWAAPSVALGLASGMVGTSADGKQYLPDVPFSRINLAHALGVLFTTDPGLYATTLEGTLKVREGIVKVQASGSQEIQVKTEITVKSGDTITIGAKSSAELNYPDGSSILIKENTQLSVVESQGRKYLKIDGSEGTAVDWLDIKLNQGTILGGLATRHEGSGNEEPASSNKTSGTLYRLGSRLIASLQGIGLLAEEENEKPPWYVASKQKKVKIQVDMPWGVAGIRGTFFQVSVASNGQSSVGCLIGNVEVSNHGVTVPLTGNQSTQVTQASAPPPPPTPLPPAAVQQFVQEQNWLQQTAQVMQQVQEAAPPPPPPAVEITVTAPLVEQVTPLTPVTPVVPTVPTTPILPLTPAASPLSVLQVINQAMQTITANPTSAPVTITVTPTSSGVIGPGSETINHAPMVSGVMISGTAQVGETLTGIYTYADAENNPEGSSTYQWYTSSSTDGTDKTVITGAACLTFTLTSSEIGKYLFFEVTPIASIGRTTGTMVTSAAFGTVLARLINPEPNPVSYAILLTSPDNYSVPVPGSTPGTTKVESLNLLSGATQWQFKVGSSAFAIPELDSTVSGAVYYAAGMDVPIDIGQHLELLATDANHGIKGYADITVLSGQIAVNNTGDDISASFTDPNFKQAVWEWLGHTGNPGAFSKQDLINRMPAQNAMLIIYNRNITSLAGLENFEGTGLTELNCENNQLTVLPPLPQGLTWLYCWGNRLTSLPELPDSLVGLYCWDNQLSSLPTLYPNLLYLDCRNNQLSSLPTLPTNLTWLFCYDNYLSSLPYLPNTLSELHIHNNYLNVFTAGSIKTGIDACPAGTKEIAPQFRYSYIGSPKSIRTAATHQLTPSELQRQDSSDGSSWSNTTNGIIADFTFSSSNPAIATVDSSGIITAVAAGSCNIYAKYKNIDSEYTRAAIPVTVGGGVLGYEFVRKWGYQGSGEGEFAYPSYMTMDGSGTLYVSDQNNNRIQALNTSGGFIREWGSLGTDNGQFDAPGGIAVSDSGDVYVADYQNKRIQHFNTLGQFIGQWGTEGTGEGQFVGASGVAVDSSGNVYVADYYNNCVQKFNASGEFLSKWGSEGANEGQFNGPEGIAIDSSGNVYVVDYGNNRIQKFNSAGDFISQWGSSGSGDGQFNGPFAICTDQFGDLYVTDCGNYRIQKFSCSGDFLSKWGSNEEGDSQFSDIGGVAVDFSGNVYVTDGIMCTINKFRPIGSTGNSESLLVINDYSEPIPGLTEGTTRIEELYLIGGATKWQINVQDNALTSIPQLNCTLSTVTIHDYHAEEDIAITAGKHLVLYATDDENHIKGFADIIMKANYIDFTTGSGTISDPYVITSARGLNDIRNDLNACYELGADIYLDLDAYASGEGWLPIGDFDNVFAGTLDGAGYTISYLTINRPNSQCVGLFGFMDYAGLIRNIKLENVSISGKDYTGGIVGRGMGTISNSCVSGDVTGTGSCTGGLAGHNYGGNINNCSADCTITGNGNNGGLAGYNEGSIVNSYAGGSITGNGNNNGGLVGYNYGTCNITNSYAMGSVNGSIAGGLVGLNYGYVINSYYDQDTTQQNDTEKGDPRISDQMKQQVTYTGWDFSSIWSITPNDYPRLQKCPQIFAWRLVGIPGVPIYNSGNNTITVEVQPGTNLQQLVATFNLSPGVSASVGGIEQISGTTVNDYSEPVTYTVIDSDNISTTWTVVVGFLANGTGATDDPYIISTANELNMVRNHLSSCFELGTSINMDGSLFDNGEGWLPIGDGNNSFTGTFNGAGHIISNLYINRAGSDFIGLFSTVTGQGSIINLGLENVSIEGNKCVGSLGGYNEGLVSDIYATGNVKSNTEYSGGLFGDHSGAISNCYTMVNVIGDLYVGGLVGSYGDGGVIDKSYSAGTVDGETETGGLVGLDYGGGTTSYSYYDTEISGQSDDTGKGVPKTTVEMKLQATFEGWDFGLIWSMNEGIDYPKLRYFVN
ncbi:MAG: S-layer homology domain-containing protein [Syntrophomonas sp.]|nr:S-layer homology domain-containing protein [Syntrophomonas sp.]